MGRSFYLYQNKNGFFCAEILDPVTGLRIVTRSTRTKNRDEAAAIAGGWVRDGIPPRTRGRKQSVQALKDLKEILQGIKNTDLDTDSAQAIAEALRVRGLLTFNTVKAGCGNKSLIAFLLDFWDYENSAYIKEKLLHGHSESRRHCIEATRYVKSKWAPYFKKRQLDSLTRQDFRDFALSLRETRTPKSINNVLSVGIVGIRWAFAEGMIPEDPTRGLIRFTGGESKRDILTEAETVKLFSIKWEDKRAYAGALLAATGGLRAGEVRGIRKEDIGDLILTVNHSWSDFDGLKSTKTGEVRRVPLLPQVRALLIELLEDSPFKELENPFVFYSEVPDKPLSDKVLLNNLKREIKKAGIDLAGRAVVFHSFRHFYASRISEIMSAEEVMRVTGHRSRAVFDSYASHIEDKNLEEMGKAGAKVFKKILPFIKKGA